MLLQKKNIKILVSTLRTPPPGPHTSVQTRTLEKKPTLYRGSIFRTLDKTMYAKQEDYDVYYYCYYTNAH